jgi:hypothetical protein
MVQKGNKFITFPGAHPGSNYDWNYYYKDNWSTMVVPADSPIEIFNASKDKENVEYSFNPYWQKQISTVLVPTGTPDRMALRISADSLLNKDHTLCFRSFYGDKFKGRMSDIPLFNELVINARSVNSDSSFIKVILVSKTGSGFATQIKLNKEFYDYYIPLSSFYPDSMVLIPRPYPGFLPFWFKAGSSEKLDLRNSEVLEIAVGPGLKSTEFKNPTGFEVEYVWFGTSNKIY